MSDLLLKEISKKELVKLVMKKGGLSKASASRMKQSELVKLLKKGKRKSPCKKSSKKKKPVVCDVTLNKLKEAISTIKKGKVSKKKSVKRKKSKKPTRKVSKPTRKVSKPTRKVSKPTRKVSKPIKKTPSISKEKMDLLKGINLKDLGVTKQTIAKLSIKEIKYLIKVKNIIQPIEKKVEKPLPPKVKAILPSTKQMIDLDTDVSDTDSDMFNSSESESDSEPEQFLAPPRKMVKGKCDLDEESLKKVETLVSKGKCDLEMESMKKIGDLLSTVALRLDKLESKMEKEKPQLESKMMEKLDQIKAQVVSLIPSDFKDTVLKKIGDLSSKVKTSEKSVEDIVKEYLKPTLEKITKKPVSEVVQDIKKTYITAAPIVPVVQQVKKIPFFGIFGKKPKEDQMVKDRLDLIFGKGNWKSIKNTLKESKDDFPIIYSATLPRDDLDHFIVKLSLPTSVEKSKEFEKKGYPILLGWNDESILFEFEDQKKKQVFIIKLTKFKSVSESKGILSILGDNKSGSIPEEKEITIPIAPKVVASKPQDFCNKFTGKDECEKQFDKDGLRDCRFLLKERRCENLPEQYKKSATYGVGGDATYQKYQAQPGKLPKK